MPLPQPTYPATRWNPAPLILTSKSERERLSHSALRAFFNVVRCWRMRDEDARALLGGASNGPYYNWKKQPERLLDTDVLTRISYLVEIFKALNILYGDQTFDECINFPN